jgi:hypothetical protein
MTQRHSEAGAERSTYMPAVIAVGTGIALYVLSKIGELVVILLLWGAYAALAYAALHTVAAWAGVPLLELIRATARRAQDWMQSGALKQKAGPALVVLNRWNVRSER